MLGPNPLYIWLCAGAMQSMIPSLKRAVEVEAAHAPMKEKPHEKKKGMSRMKKRKA